MGPGPPGGRLPGRPPLEPGVDSGSLDSPQMPAAQTVGGAPEPGQPPGGKTRSPQEGPVWTRGRRSPRGPGSQPPPLSSSATRVQRQPSPGRPLAVSRWRGPGGPSPALCPRPRRHDSTSGEDGHPAADDGEAPRAPGPCPAAPPRRPLAFVQQESFTKERHARGRLASSQIPSHPLLQDLLRPGPHAWTSLSGHPPDL